MAAGLSYQARKEHQAETAATGTPECLRSGCHDPAADDSAYCVPHRDAQRAADRKYRKGVRKRRKRNKECRDCGVALLPATKTRPAEKIWCTAHRIERNRLNALRFATTAGVDNRVEKSERIAAATRTHGDGRTRYHGTGKRGQQPAAVLNQQDAGMARECFGAFLAGVEVLAGARDAHRGWRDSVQRATANRGEQARRHIGDVIERLMGRTGDDEAEPWKYTRPADAAEIAQARVGEYVYAPPADAATPDGRQPRADLAPLRAALATRGLALAPEGAFYWQIVEQGGHAKQRHGRRDGE